MIPISSSLPTFIGRPMPWRGTPSMADRSISEAGGDRTSVAA